MGCPAGKFHSRLGSYISDENRIHLIYIKDVLNFVEGGKLNLKTICNPCEQTGELLLEYVDKSRFAEERETESLSILYTRGAERRIEHI